VGITGNPKDNASFSAYHNQFIFSKQVFKQWREVVVRSSILCCPPLAQETKLVRSQDHFNSSRLCFHGSAAKQLTLPPVP